MGTNNELNRQGSTAQHKGSHSKSWPCPARALATLGLGWLGDVICSAASGECHREIDMEEITRFVQQDPSRNYDDSASVATRHVNLGDSWRWLNST